MHWTQAVRKKLEPGRKRHEFQSNHGFRKWFKTQCELAGMKSINIAYGTFSWNVKFILQGNRKRHTSRKPALHNIRLTFEAKGIWTTFSNIYAEKINPDNKNIQLPTSTFKYMEIIVTIHHSDTVSIAISCSFRPIVIDTKDIADLTEALSRTELNLCNIIEKYGCSTAVEAIPTCEKWIVKLWHFGVDTVDEYTGKEFEVTFDEGKSDLYRLYTKQMKGGKNIVRIEHQENPNQAFADAMVRKLYPEGRLVVPGEPKNA
jgi:hypothetical protein